LAIIAIDAVEGPDSQGRHLLAYSEEAIPCDCVEPKSFVSSIGLSPSIVNGTSLNVSTQVDCSGSMASIPFRSKLSISCSSGLDLQRELADGSGPPIVFITSHGDTPSSVSS